MLRVTIDDLIYENLDELTPNEESLIAFMHRLAENTKKDLVNWEKETPEQHRSFEKPYYEIDCPHVLYGLGVEEDEDGGSIPNGWIYASRFFPEKQVKIKDVSYYARINDDDYIYIMACAFSGSVETMFYELYHIDVDKEVYPICTTFRAEERIIKVVEQLVRQVKESQGRIRHSQKTKVLFDTYKEGGSFL